MTNTQRLESFKDAEDKENDRLVRQEVAELLLNGGGLEAYALTREDARIIADIGMHAAEEALETVWRVIHQAPPRVPPMLAMVVALQMSQKLMESLKVSSTENLPREAFARQILAAAEKAAIESGGTT